MSLSLKPIGIIHTPFKSKTGIPIQSNLANGIRGSIELEEEFIPGLIDLDGFSHIILIYYFHKSTGYALRIKPFLDDKEHGVFSTRAPKRPNPIGISVVRLLQMERNILTIENVDMIDGTPLLDIKPYVPYFDIHNVEKSGWVEDNKNKMHDIRSDNRFE